MTTHTTPWYPADRQLLAQWAIDGVLFDAFNLPKDVQEEAVSVS